MLLVLDVGNTNITAGIYKKEKLVTTFRISSKSSKTSDEYGLLLSQFLAAQNIEICDIYGAAIASVVPNIMHSLISSIKKVFNFAPLIVGTGVKTGIKVLIQNPKSVGADRIADAVAAFESYKGPAIVVDFGTGTTYDLIGEDGSFMAGVTAPGLRVSAESLWENTARLPEIEIKAPKSILAKETIESMRAGIVYGQIGQMEYIVKKMREEANLPNAKVVITGGIGRLVADGCGIDVEYNRYLTLEGIRLIYEKNKNEVS